MSQIRTNPLPGAPRRSYRPAVLVVLGLVAIGTSACSTKRVERIDPTAVTDLSGRWNDTDSRLVANELIEQSLSASWARNYSVARGGEAPPVIVGEFRNRTMEHIPVNTFIRDLERAFVSSGTVRVVASSDQREEIRTEREDQQEHANASTRARLGQELGAKYVLQGEIDAIEDEEGRERVVYYQVDARLVDLESNEMIWLGNHEIKKTITRSRLGW